MAEVSLKKGVKVLMEFSVMAQLTWALCYFNMTLILLPLLLLLGGLTPGSCCAYENEPEPELGTDHMVVHHGNILSPLLRALSEHEPWAVNAPRARPDSRYVRFMKRLYKVASKHERSHDASQLYNTVRLITPRQECVDLHREIFMQDISYSLGRVRAQEWLLKSVLLYSVEHNHVALHASICHLYIKEQLPFGDGVCLGAPALLRRPATPFSFRIRGNRAGRREWMEVDVTSFLHPLILSHKKDIHLLINLTCLVEDGGAGVPVTLTHTAPSLLLYLNDTSKMAYQRSSVQRVSRPGGIFSNRWDEGVFPLQRRYSRSLKQKKRSRRGSQNKTQIPQSGAETDHLLDYEFPTDDCDLYDFRVSFSQLKLDHWIIAPNKYNPRYCKGICPRVMGHIYGSPVHTMVQNIIYEKLNSNIPRPSCVPSHYDPLSVVTIENDGSIAYKEYEEMIATKCTCR